MKLKPIDECDEYRDVFKAHEASAALSVLFFIAQGMLPAINRCETSLHQSGIPFFLEYSFKQHFNNGAKGLKTAYKEFGYVNELFGVQLNGPTYDKGLAMANDLWKFLFLFFDRCCTKDDDGNYMLNDKKVEYVHKLLQNGMSGQGIISDEFINHFKLRY